jgi:hypothetical protein
MVDPPSGFANPIFHPIAPVDGGPSHYPHGSKTTGAVLSAIFDSFGSINIYLRSPSLFQQAAIKTGSSSA